MVLAWHGAGAAEPEPRTLILALDGVPLRLVERAREQGAFGDWPDPVPLVSTFPSMTNVAFTAMLRSFGTPAAKGYEIYHYDRERNHMVGRLPFFRYRKHSFAWRDHFDVAGRSIGSKVTTYSRPRGDSRKSLKKTERFLFEHTQDLILAHAGGTDAMVHMRGEEAALRFLLELDGWLAELKRRSLEHEGRPLRIVLLSDHGNTNGKVRNVKGLRRSLRREGFRIKKKLERPDDVVAPTFGMVNYGALFLFPQSAERAAGAITEHDSVELAAWKSGPAAIDIVSREGSGRLRWTEGPEGRWIAYSWVGSDPLALGEAIDELRRNGALNDRGFAHEDEWLGATIDGPYPDAPRRLVDALDGSFVDNHATVIFSLEPGHAWGWKSARFMAWLSGGKLEGTHGGLDRGSSLGFFMTDDLQLAHEGAVSADRALAGIGELLGE